MSIRVSAVVMLSTWVVLSAGASDPPAPGAGSASTTTRPASSLPPAPAAGTGAVAATSEQAWSKLDAAPPAVLSGTPWVRPATGHVLALDVGRMATALSAAPMRGQVSVRQSSAIIGLPNPDGVFEHFAFVEWPVMEPALQAKYPQIRTYMGQGVEVPGDVVCFDLTPRGFHAQVLTSNADDSGAHTAWYIDPLTGGDTAHYTSYWRGAAIASAPWSCTTPQPEPPALPRKMSELPQRSSILTGNGTVLLVEFRVAVAATAEFATSVSAPNPPNVTDTLAAIATTIQRVNGPYHIDLAVHLLLVANNDQIIYTNAATEPYSGSQGQMQSQNQSNLDSVIGSGNYDLGHLFHFQASGYLGNAGGIGTVCNNSTKGKGASFTSDASGTQFAIDEVAHEMGHQLGGTHTFNGVSGSCASVAGSPQWTAATAYEPGSGSTIMSYGGTCGADNVVSGVAPAGAKFPMFNFSAIDQIEAVVASSCGVGLDTGDYPPTAITAPGPIVLPTNTPFWLSGAGFDPDSSQTLYFSWEEMDKSANALPLGPDTGAGEPLFKPLMYSSTGDTRFFPPLANVVAGTSALGENLPQFARTSLFRLVVRDRNIQGGGVGTVDTTVQFVPVPGSFSVTAPAGGGVYCGGSIIAVTWNVANTNQPPINADRVSVTLSADGGQTFPTVLGTNIPNGGAALVTLPAIYTTQARLRVDGGQFYAVNPANFEIDSGPPTIAQSPASVSVCPNQPVLLLAFFGGGLPEHIQWYKDGVPIADQGPLPGFPHSSQIVLSSAQHADTGDYVVSVSNACQTVTSSPARVQVGVTFDLQPQNQTPNPCDNVVLTVQAQGVGPLSYQWSKDGVAMTEGPGIIGTTSPTLDIIGVRYEDEGRYTCAVTDSCETRTTIPVSVTLPTPQWVQKSTTGPGHRGYTSDMAYDPVRRVTVLYGGLGPDAAGNAVYQNDTWEWDGVAWTQRFPPHDPGARGGHNLVFDNSRNVVLLMGGYGGVTFNNEVWAYDGNDWTMLSPTTDSGPPANLLSGGHAVFDSARAKLVAFTRLPSDEFGNDTWEFDSASLTWTLAGSGIYPSAPDRFYAGFAYDSVHHDTVSQEYAFLSDPSIPANAPTWTWNGTAWNFTGILSPARFAPSMAFDTTRRQSVLYGCCRGTGPGVYIMDTYAFDGSSWRQILPPLNTTQYDAVVPTAMVYDTARRAMVMVGSDYNGSFATAPIATWEYRYLDRVMIDRQPQPQTLVVGSTATFQVYAAGFGSLTYQWRRNGQPITDGPAPGGGTFTGASTPMLTLTPTGAADAGLYTCLVGNACGSITSHSAALGSIVPVPADLDGDGDVDSADVALLRACILGPRVVQNDPACAPADLDHDGDVDQDDFGLLQRCFAGSGVTPSCTP